MILFSSILPNILNATNDCDTDLQIASEKLIHPSLNGTRVVNTNLNRPISLCSIKAKTLANFCNSLLSRGMATNEQDLMQDEMKLIANYS